MRDNPWENFTIIVEDYFFVSNQMLKIICRGNYLLFLLKLYEKKSHSKMKFRSIREILYRWSIIYDNSEAIISQNMSKCDKASTTKYIGKKVMCANHTPKRGVDIAPHTANCDRSTKTSRYYRGCSAVQPAVRDLQFFVTFDRDRDLHRAG